MKKILGPYKNYCGTVEIDFENYVLYGEVIGLRDVIAYEGKTVEELENSFKQSLDAYLKFCEEKGESPEKPYSGKFNLRISPELHKQLSFEAALQDKSLNAYIEETLQSCLSRSTEQPRKAHPRYAPD